MSKGSVNAERFQRRSVKFLKGEPHGEPVPERSKVERAAELVEKDLLDWLGLLPESEAPQTVEGYEAKLRTLGSSLVAKGATAPEVLSALALEYLKRAAPGAGNPRSAIHLLGRAKQLTVAAKNLERMGADAESVGKALEAQISDKDSEALAPLP